MSTGLMEKAAIAAAVMSCLLAMSGDRSARKPGNLAPIQLISAAGAWALILANASAIAIAIRDGSLLLLGTAVATTAIALILFLRDGVVPIRQRAPDPIDRFLGDVKQLLGSAPRLGMDAVDAMVVDGRCPGIGVTVVRQRRVVVRIRRDVVQWLDRHQQRGGAGAPLIGSFVRFVVMHELGHVLNGDHRTFRFVRSVLVAHLVWIAGAVGAAVSLAVKDGASARPLVVAGSIGVMFAAQALVARGFVAERERLADWRAMQTLAPVDAARLLERRGRPREVPNPTELEKLMTDLRAQVPPRAGGGWLARLVALVWPEGDDIHQRCETAASEHRGGDPRPVRWAALVGMQCGFLSMSLSLTVMLAGAPWIGSRQEVTLNVMGAIVAWIGAPAIVFSVQRVNPARMSMKSVKYGRLRVVVGIVFYLSFLAASVTLYCFHSGFGVPWLPPPFYFGFVFALMMGLLGCCVWMCGVIGGSGGAGELQPAPRAYWVGIVPLAVSLAAIHIPLSIAAASWLGIGDFRSWQWVAVAFLAFGSFVTSTAMARSTNPVLRAIAPMATLDTPVPVIGYRVFWRDFYIDLARTSLVRAAMAATAVQAPMLPFFVLLSGLLMRGLRSVLSAQATFLGVFIGAFGVFFLVVVIPHRVDAYRGPSLQLLYRERLQVFEDLLAAARLANSPAADRLQAALVPWLRDRQLPNPVLPDARNVWMLPPLLSLVRLAHATGESSVIGWWRDRIETSLREIVVEYAVAVAPGQPPSLHWTVLAVQIVDEAGLRQAFRFDRMLDRIERLLNERLDAGALNLLTDVVQACRLLQRHGRPTPDAQRIHRFAHASSLVARPLLRQSLLELCELAELTGDAELRLKLGTIVRSRLWEALQLNPRKDVLLLLDCSLALACLGEAASSQAASRVLEELADGVAKELTAIVATA